MKKTLLFILVIIGSVSCKNTWNEDDKQSFCQACTDEANKWAGAPEKAKTYCDCVLQKMMDRYPNENDALEHIDQLTQDTSLINCKNEVMN